MKKLDLKDLKNFNCKTCITIGFFDGIHLGHQEILASLVNFSNKNNLKSVVITFDNSISKLFKSTNNLMDFDEKLKILNNYKVDYICILNINDNFMSLSAQEFINNYLEKLNCKALICGNDFSFAKNKEGNIDYLKHNTTYDVIIVDDKYINDNKISSSYIRLLLNNGKIKEANELMFEPFKVKSLVIKGLQIGRTIGFKTANLLVNDSLCLLKHGVYFALAIVNNKKYKAMVNVGNNPTINSINDNLKVEVHILEFDDDIYNTYIEVIFYDYIRSEKMFSSLNDLKEQLIKDINKLKITNFTKITRSSSK